MLRATIVDDIDDLRGADCAPGTISIDRYRGDDIDGVHFICPCGCGREGYLPADGTGHPQQWVFTQTPLGLTARPSIRQVGGCAWHGWLTDGEWRQC